MPRKKKSKRQNRKKRKSLSEEELDHVISDDLKTLAAYGSEIEGLKCIESEIQELRYDLAKIDRQACKDEKDFPSESSITDFLAGILALGRVARFLLIRAPSDAISKVLVALQQQSVGHRPPMLEPIFPGSHAGDPASIQSIKGVLAGLMAVKQQEGWSRQHAAAFVVRHMSPKLAAATSRNPITPRAVEEWRDRFGGKSPPDNAGGATYKVWSRPGREKLSISRLHEITERMSAWVPKA
jgi:hypothetical protein